MSDTSIPYDPIEGLDKALEIQGGIHGLDEVRTDSGLYLHLDIWEFLARRQTYEVNALSTVMNASGGAGSYTSYIPASTGLRYGRYLTALAIFSTSVANLLGGMILLGNSGIQPDYPAHSGTPIALIGPTADAVQITNTANNYYLPFRSTGATLPRWMPPGSYLYLQIATSGVSGNYTGNATFATTEELSSPLVSATRTPVGQLRAPIMR